MPKTMHRGNWPGKPSLKVVDETWQKPDNHAWCRGTSRYAEQIDSLLSVKPGTRAIECPSKKEAMALVLAIARHLKQDGIDHKVRPAVRKDSETCCKVWVVER